MVKRLVLALAATTCLVVAARADGVSPLTMGAQPLPTLALDPAPPPSIWTGLHVGTELFVVSRRGQKGLVGGGVNVGYDREFANNIVLGVEASSGYSPTLFGHGRIRGFNYATLDAKVGYDMGRVMPFVTTGLVLAKPNTGPGMGYVASDSINNLFNGASNLEASGRVGAGVDYALTNNLHVGVAVSVARGNGLLVP